MEFIVEDFCQTGSDDAISYATELKYTCKEEFSQERIIEIYRKLPPIDETKQITNIHH